MATLTIQAVQISLGQEFAEDTTLGLYTVAGLSYLRWSEAPLVGVAETWSSDILLKNGISETVESSNLSRGGNIAEYSGLTVRATNAEDLKVYLDDLGVNLIGLSATMIEFEGSSTDSDSVARTTRFTGVVEDIKWGETTLTISLKNSIYKRETNIGTVTSEGVEVPVTFGKHTPPLTKVVDGVSTATTEIRNLAKFVRTDDTQTVLSDDYFTGSGYTDTNIFPLETIVSIVEYNCKLRGSSVLSIDPTDVYVIVTDGDGEGQIRQIDSFTIVDGVGGKYIDFILKDVFYTQLSTSTSTRSWIKFVRITREYKSDIWPCETSLSALSGTAINSAELFSYAEDSFGRIADFGLKKIGSENNYFEIDGQQYSDNIDSLDSFLILPATSLALENTADLSAWNNDKFNYDVISGSTIQMQRVVDGIYATSPGSISVTSANLLNSSNAYDQNKSTYADFSPVVTVSAGDKYAKMLKFGLPKIPKDTNVEKIYLGIKMSALAALSESYSNHSVVVNSYDKDYSSQHFIFKRFHRTKAEDVICDNKNITYYQQTAADVQIDCLPDFYYTPRPSSYNVNFYKPSQSSTIGGYPDLYSGLSGYTLFEITDNADIYNTFVEGGIFQYVSAGPFAGSYNEYIKIYEIAIIIKTASSDIKKEIYSPLSGRIYNDTWGRGKPSANLIENPKDIIEHCCRLKNWSEIQGHTDIEWGKAYSPDALIKTSGEGSFDSTNLDYLATEKVCLQITDKDKQTTTAITKKLCDTAHVCSYIDSDGYECLETLEATNPSETINLDDVIGSIGDVIEPQIENIYCEPVINYLYNQGSQKFDRTMSVTNIGESAWQSSYTPGYLDADGQIIWNTCKALYQKYRQIERCPDEFSNHPELADYQTVVNYVKRKLAWMDKKRLPTITLAYSKGKDYTIFKHLLVQLPTHTRNTVIECIIEKIVKDKNSGTVKIDCVVLGNMESAWYDTSDSLNEKIDTTDSGNEAIIDV